MLWVFSILCLRQNFLNSSWKAGYMLWVFSIHFLNSSWKAGKYALNIFDSFVWEKSRLGKCTSRSAIERILDFNFFLILNLILILILTQFQKKKMKTYRYNVSVNYWIQINTAHTRWNMFLKIFITASLNSFQILFYFF